MVPCLVKEKGKNWGTMTLEEVLKEIHYLKNYMGYPCLVSCIKMVKEDETRLWAVRKKVYVPVAEKYGLKLQNMERNLRTVRDAFQIHGGIEFLKSQLGGGVDPDLYPREMIEALAECISDE